MVDAHLPMQLVYYLRERGHDVIHTRELPQKNETEDADIIQIAVRENRTVVSKDADFFQHYILKGEPPKLLILTMGNIINKELLTLFQVNIDLIENDLSQNKVVELSNEVVTVHY